MIKKFNEMNILQEEIVKRVGKNTTGSGKVANDDLEFSPVKLSDGSEVYSFYTYKGKVCVLDDQGMDNDFEDYSQKDQKLIYDSIISKY